MSLALANEAKIAEASLKEIDTDDLIEKLLERPISPHINYVTARGLQNITEKITELERTRDIAKRLQDLSLIAEVDRDLRYWNQRKMTAHLVSVSAQPQYVEVGVVVHLKYGDKTVRFFKLVGEDEANPEKGLISWISPVAQAMVDCQVNDEVIVQGRRAIIMAIKPYKD
ncbi:MAG: transcription elongation factor [Verrucomicrobiaceae bacterium]|nr:transcription elongation factor [Verrucomicrobiaceae bacterium]